MADGEIERVKIDFEHVVAAWEGLPLGDLDAKLVQDTDLHGAMELMAEPSHRIGEVGRLVAGEATELCNQTRNNIARGAQLVAQLLGGDEAKIFDLTFAAGVAAQHAGKVQEHSAGMQQCVENTQALLALIDKEVETFHKHREQVRRNIIDTDTSRNDAITVVKAHMRNL